MLLTPRSIKLCMMIISWTSSRLPLYFSPACETQFSTRVVIISHSTESLRVGRLAKLIYLLRRHERTRKKLKWAIRPHLLVCHCQLGPLEYLPCLVFCFFSVVVCASSSPENQGKSAHVS